MNKEQVLKIISSFINDISNPNLNMNDLEGRQMMLDALLLIQEYVESENKAENIVTNTLKSLGITN